MTVFAVSFALYTLAIVGVGLWSARRAKDSDEDYFLAGRSLNRWVAALSASASSESGWVTLGLVGMAYASGVQAYWILPGCLLGYAFNWFVLARRLRAAGAEVNAVTIPDLFALRFGERLPLLRLLSVVVILVAMFMYVAAQLAAAGKAFEQSFPGLDYRWGVVIGGAIVLVYTVLGGFRAACWTDFAQAALMVGVLFLFPLYFLLADGGPGATIEALRSIEDPDYLSIWPGATGFGLLGFLLGSGALGLNFGFPGQPHVLVRFLALRDDREARAGGIIALAWGAMVFAGAVTIGLLARAASARGEAWTASLEADPELALVVSAQSLLPGAVSGLALAAVLAAICSTADSQLVVAASAAANDVYARLFDRAKRSTHLLVNRLTVLALGAGAVFAVMDQRVQVYRFVTDYGWAVLGAAFGPQVILMLLWRRATYLGTLAGMATGFLVAVAWPQVYDRGWLIDLGEGFAPQGTGPEVYNLPLAFCCALGVNVLVSLAAFRTQD